MEALERRRGAAEQAGAAFHLRAQDGDVASVVARGFLLLVGVLVLFIDDDEAEVGARGEDGRPGADDDAGAAGADLVPLVVPLAFAEVGMEHGDFVLGGGEAGFEALDGLRGEGNLRHEHDGGLPALEDELDGLEVNLGLAAAGDAVKEEGLGRGWPEVRRLA